MRSPSRVCPGCSPAEARAAAESRRRVLLQLSYMPQQEDIWRWIDQLEMFRFVSANDKRFRWGDELLVALGTSSKEENERIAAAVRSSAPGGDRRSVHFEISDGSLKIAVTGTELSATVTDTDVALALTIEDRLRELRVRIVDPPDKSPDCISPSTAPAFFERRYRTDPAAFRSYAQIMTGYVQQQIRDGSYEQWTTPPVAQLLRRLRYFRLVGPSWIPLAGTARLCAALRYGSSDDLATLCPLLGISLEHPSAAPDAPQCLIPGTGWLQPEWQMIAGDEVFVRCLGDKMMIDVVLDDERGLEARVGVAGRVEGALDRVADRVIDPPIATPRCIAPLISAG